MLTAPEGKVAVVTGGASGIGRAMGLRFAKAGMRVVLADVEPAALFTTVAELEATGAEVIGVPTDVREESDLEDLAAATLERFGAAHLLCNNAGVESGARFADIPIATWRWVMDVNFFGVVNGCRAFLPQLQSNREGHIVNTASLSAVSAGIRTFGPYAASKFAVLGFTENLAVELAAEAPGVGVSVLLPGAVRTNMPDAERNLPAGLTAAAADPVRDQVMAGLRARTAESGLEPSEIADLVLDAVVADRFWILPHRDAALAAVADRLDAMTRDRRPAGRTAGG